uniref:Uncharacterized protein n=1 Tax=Anguilla anguilla TaxID=7936 RepID=A0A0E9RIB6_ANGAN
MINKYIYLWNTFCTVFCGSQFVLCAHREKFRGEKVPTLQEAVEECLRHQLTIYFDVKGHAEEVRARST